MRMIVGQRYNYYINGKDNTIEIVGTIIKNICGEKIKFYKAIMLEKLYNMPLLIPESNELNLRPYE